MFRVRVRVSIKLLHNWEMQTPLVCGRQAAVLVGACQEGPADCLPQQRCSVGKLRGLKPCSALRPRNASESREKAYTAPT